MSGTVMEPIGYVRGGRTTIEDDGWAQVVSSVELDPDQIDAAGLEGLGAFSHVEVVYVFDQVDPETICRGKRHPRGRADWPEVGILAQRAKDRPNRIGVTVCALRSVTNMTIEVAGLDAVDGTPVLDVKPYMSGFAPRGPVREPSWARELMQDYWEAEGATMIARLRPTVVSAKGAPPKHIHEFVGGASSGDDSLSLAVMHSPAGWTEPAQMARFTEVTIVMEGTVVLHLADGDEIRVESGEAVSVPPDTPVRYATPSSTVYVSLCRPAFRPDRVTRDASS